MTECRYVASSPSLNHRSFRSSTAGVAVVPATAPHFLVALPPTTDLCYDTAVAVRAVRIRYLAVCGTELYGTRYSHVIGVLALDISASAPCDSLNLEGYHYQLESRRGRFHFCMLQYGVM